MVAVPQKVSDAVSPALDREPAASLLAAAAGEAGGLERERVISNAAVMLFGGIETTDGMIANAVLHLLSRPDQLALVKADAGLLANAIEESLRLEPAAAVVDRYATADIELTGAPIGRSELVRISIAGANRDPAVFPDPDCFDVRRVNAHRHVAFAHGPHVCIGMHLARLEAHTAVEQLLRCLPELRLDPDKPAEPRGLVFRKPPELHVLWADAQAGASDFKTPPSENARHGGSSNVPTCRPLLPGLITRSVITTWSRLPPGRGPWSSTRTESIVATRPLGCQRIGRPRAASTACCFTTVRPPTVVR